MAIPGTFSREFSFGNRLLFMDWYGGLFISGIPFRKSYPVLRKLNSSLFICGTVYKSNIPAMCCLASRMLSMSGSIRAHYSCLGILHGGP